MRKEKKILIYSKETSLVSLIYASLINNKINTPVENWTKDMDKKFLKGEMHVIIFLNVHTH